MPDLLFFPQNFLKGNYNLVYKAFLFGKKIKIYWEKEKRKRKNHQQPIQAVYDSAKAVFVITTPRETWAVT